MPTFDIVSEVDKTEVKNAVEQTNKEVSTRFDFKGSDARVEQAELKLTVWADNEFQLDQVQDILNGKTGQTRCGYQVPGDQRQDRKGQRQQGETRLRGQGRRGIELAKKIVKHIKDSKLKVQASIQGDTVRVTGKNRDDLQDAIAFVKKTITDFPLQYQNFRD